MTFIDDLEARNRDRSLLHIEPEGAKHIFALLDGVLPLDVTIGIEDSMDVKALWKARFKDRVGLGLLGTAEATLVALVHQESGHVLAEPWVGLFAGSLDHGAMSLSEEGGKC